MKSIRKKLTLATCSLLSQHAGAQAFENDWVLDTAYLSYQESNERVSVNKFIGNVRGQVSDDDSVKLQVVHDTMSGASPSGAVKSNNESVTFTGASGSSGFSAGGATSSLVHFEDTRLAVGLDWDHALSRSLKTTYGANISTENDYESYGSKLGVEKESRNKLNTYSAGVSYSADTIFRGSASDTPAPLTSTSETDSFDKGERNTWDAIAGLTRVINKRTVGQINLSYSVSQGYHTDPYKVISAIDAAGNIVDNFYESRPGERKRTSMYSNLAHELAGNGNVIHASYRLYQDDWNVRSHTFNLKYRNKLGNQQFIEPNLRLYRQTAANFYKHHLSVDEDVNVNFPESEHASADYRLDRLWSYTVGLKYGLPLGNAGDLRLRTEYIKQTFAHSEFKTNAAVVFQASYKYSF